MTQRSIERKAHASNPGATAGYVAVADLFLLTGALSLACGATGFFS
jgi:hypothetical protein